MTPRAEQHFATTTTWRRDVCLWLVVLATRLPFLGHGYGLDVDAWLLVDAGRAIDTEGVYRVSRFPGYPLPERVMSFVWNADPRLVNGITALASACAAVLFHRILQRHRCRFAFFAALAFACVPVIYVHSVDAMDYQWALVFVLLAWWLAAADRPALAGLACGLVVASRPSAIALWPCIALGVASARERGRLRALALAGGVAAAVSALAFLPNYLRYGWEFARTTPSPVSFAHALREFGPRVWGSTGLWGAALAALHGVWLRLRRAAPAPRAQPALAVATRAELAAWWVAVLCASAAFAAMPHDGAYLISALPFALLLAARALPALAFAELCAALVLAPFVELSLRPLAVLPGPILRDRTERELQVRRIDTVFDELDRRGEHKAAVLAGPLYMPLTVEYLRRGRTDVEHAITNRLTLAEVQQCRELGYSVYTLSLDGVVFAPFVEDGAQVIALPSR